MKQKAITTEAMRFEADANTEFTVYADFRDVVLKLIINRQRAEGMEGAGYEAAEAEIITVGADLYQYWAENPATPKQAYNRFFK